MSAADKGYLEVRVALPAVQAKEPTRRTTVACIDEDHLIHIHLVP